MKTLAFFAGLVLVLSGCGHHPTPTPAHHKVPDRDSVFLSAVYQKYPNLSSEVSATSLIELAHQSCAALDRGATPQDLAEAVANDTTSVEQAKEFGFVIGAGVATYCPEHRDDFTNYTGTSA